MRQNASLTSMNWPSLILETVLPNGLSKKARRYSSCASSAALRAVMSMTTPWYASSSPAPSNTGWPRVISQRGCSGLVPRTRHVHSKPRCAARASEQERSAASASHGSMDDNQAR